MKHLSVADDNVQERRRRVRVPGGKPLHEYVNLYINARNPMLYKLQGQHQELCILRVSTAVVDLEDVVIADRNASSGYAKFDNSTNGLIGIDKERVFAKYWTHDNELETLIHKSVMCAEVLVPNKISSDFIIGVYTSCQETLEKLLSFMESKSIEIAVNPHIFFR